MLFDVDWGDSKDQNIKALHDRLNQLDELSKQLDALRDALRAQSGDEGQAERWRALDARLAEMSEAMLTADALAAWTPPSPSSDALTAAELQSALAGLEQAIASQPTGAAPDLEWRASVNEAFRGLHARLDAAAASGAAQPTTAPPNQSAMDEALVKMVLAVSDRLGRPAVSPLILGLALLQVLSLLLLVGLLVKVMVS